MREPRPSIVGEDSGPSPPFPLKLSGPVIKGFGRGSKELGIPTANIPIDGLSVAGHTDLSSGVYFGYCSLLHQEPSSESYTSPTIYQMVLSIGYNPFYKNTVRSVEVHILHAFEQDFYGSHLKLLILGFVREELDYVSKEALVEDIRTDIDVSRRAMQRDAWKVYEADSWLKEEVSGQS